MTGYTLLSEFLSDSGAKKATVLKDNQGNGMYKVTFLSSEFPQSTLFKFFTDQQEAEDVAEEWVLKNE